MSLYHKIVSNLYEMDHEDKPEDYTYASPMFDDIFLNGDYLKSDSGIKVVYRKYDEDTHEIKPVGLDNYYWASSRDGEVWKIVYNRQIVDEKEGRPIDIAKYIGNLNEE